MNQSLYLNLIKLAAEKQYPEQSKKQKAKRGAEDMKGFREAMGLSLEETKSDLSKQFNLEGTKAQRLERLKQMKGQLERDSEAIREKRQVQRETQSPPVQPPPVPPAASPAARREPIKFRSRAPELAPVSLPGRPLTAGGPAVLPASSAVKVPGKAGAILKTLLTAAGIGGAGFAAGAGGTTWALNRPRPVEPESSESEFPLGSREKLQQALLIGGGGVALLTALSVLAAQRRANAQNT
jgi:hypothetical protein